MKILAWMLFLTGCFTATKPTKIDPVDITGRQISEWIKICENNGGINKVNVRPDRRVKCYKNSVKFVW